LQYRFDRRVPAGLVDSKMQANSEEKPYGLWLHGGATYMTSVHRMR
jgi:hypothetical protein